MNIKQVGQVAAVSTLSGLATRYLLNRFLSDYTSEKVRNIASLAIGLGCGFSTRNCSLKTLLSSIGIVGGNLLSLNLLLMINLLMLISKKPKLSRAGFLFSRCNDRP